MKEKESIYDEARMTVYELNKTYGVQSEGRFFVYTENAFDCGIEISDIPLWDSEGDGRYQDEETGVYEPLKTCVLRKVEELRESLKQILEGVKADEA